MTEAFSAASIAVSLMKEALTLLDAPEAARAAQLLRLAIEAVSGVAFTTTDAAEAPPPSRIDER